MNPNTYNCKLTTIRVEKLRLRAYIGFSPWEKEKLQDLVISYSFKYDVKNAAENDDVMWAVNYKAITKGIIERIEHNEFQLIETVGELVLGYIKSFSEKIEGGEVVIEKPNALRFCDNVKVVASDKDRYNTVLVSMGSNINANENFAKAIQMMQEIGIVTQRTEFITTKPLKFQDQPDFLNGALLVLTKKSLFEFKMLLKQIEVVLGRVRKANKNAPREIDLDVVTFNKAIIDEEIAEFPFLVKFVEQLQPQVLLNL